MNKTIVAVVLLSVAVLLVAFCDNGTVTINSMPVWQPVVEMSHLGSIEFTVTNGAVNPFKADFYTGRKMSQAEINWLIYAGDRLDRVELWRNTAGIFSGGHSPEAYFAIDLASGDLFWKVSGKLSPKLLSLPLGKQIAVVTEYESGRKTLEYFVITKDMMIDPLYAAKIIQK